LTGVKTLSQVTEGVTTDDQQQQCWVNFQARMAYNGETACHGPRQTGRVIWTMSSHTVTVTDFGRARSLERATATNGAQSSQHQQQRHLKPSRLLHSPSYWPRFLRHRILNPKSVYIIHEARDLTVSSNDAVGQVLADQRPPVVEHFSPSPKHSYASTEHSGQVHSNDFQCCIYRQYELQ